MDAIPYVLKQKLRAYSKAVSKSKELHDEIVQSLDSYGVPYENLVALSDYDEPTTEALSYINNAEGYIEDNIDEMEEVFLYFANKKILKGDD